VIIAGNGQSDAFEGVSERELIASGITILDYDPAERISFPDEVARRYEEEGATIEVQQLTRIYLYTGSAIPIASEHLAWAVRLDPSGVPTLPGGGYHGVPGHLNPNATLAIAFVDAESGQLLKLFERLPSGGVASDY
jgi:hypothetical protein